MDAFRKMKQLRLDFEKVRTLLDLVRKREKLHRMLIMAGNESFEQQVYNIVDTSGLQRVSKILKRDSMEELLLTPQHFDTDAGESKNMRNGVRHPYLPPVFHHRPQHRRPS